MSYNKPEKEFGEAPVRCFPATGLAHVCSRLTLDTESPQDSSVARRPHATPAPQADKTAQTGITLTSRKVQSLEKVCQELIERAKNKDLRAKGPVRMPTKILKITVGPWFAFCTPLEAREGERLTRMATDAQDALR